MLQLVEECECSFAEVAEFIEGYRVERVACVCLLLGLKDEAHNAIEF